MGSLGRILGKVTLHALGLWALARLYGDLHERGLVGSVLGTSAANGHGVVADIIPKSILALQVGFLFGRVELAVAGAYALYLLAVVYRWIFTPTDSVHHYKTRDMGHQIPPGELASAGGTTCSYAFKWRDMPHDIDAVYAPENI